MPTPTWPVGGVSRYSGTITINYDLTVTLDFSNYAIDLGYDIDEAPANEDVIIGVFNNAGAVDSLTFDLSDPSNAAAFSLEIGPHSFPLRDSIQDYGTPPPTTGLPGGYVMTTYEGPDNYFELVGGFAFGLVHFIGQLPPGGETFFGLEGPPDLSGLSITPQGTPGSPPLVLAGSGRRFVAGMLV